MADSFRRRRRDELDALEDEELIAYGSQARRAGDDAALADAIAVLVWGHLALVQHRVALKVPGADVEDVASEVLASAIQSAFDGESVGEFRVWLSTIIKRRIADFHRAAERRLKAGSLDRGDGEDGWSDEPAAPDQTGVVLVNETIARVYGRRGALHQLVVDLRVFAHVPSAQTAERVNARLAPDPAMTVANVDAIASRFRRDLRAALDAGDTGIR